MWGVWLGRRTPEALGPRARGLDRPGSAWPFDFSRLLRLGGDRGEEDVRIDKGHSAATLVEGLSGQVVTAGGVRATTGNLGQQSFQLMGRFFMRCLRCRKSLEVFFDQGGYGSTQPGGAARRHAAGLLIQRESDVPQRFRCTTFSHFYKIQAPREAAQLFVGMKEPSHGVVALLNQSALVTGESRSEAHRILFDHAFLQVGTIKVPPLADSLFPALTTFAMRRPNSKASVIRPLIRISGVVRKATHAPEKPALPFWVGSEENRLPSVLENPAPGTHTLRARLPLPAPLSNPNPHVSPRSLH